MTIRGDWVRYWDNTPGYLAFPERARLPLPGIVVLQEAWGVDLHIEDVTRRFAAAGYAAFAPDLYAIGGERPAELSRARIAQARAMIDGMFPTPWIDPAAREAALSAQPEPARAEIRETLKMILGGLDPSARLSPLMAAAEYLREHCPASRGRKIGSVGFCMGGGLSGLLGSINPRVACSVVFYGMLTDNGTIDPAGGPLLGFFGENDPRFTNAAAPFAEAMKRAGRQFDYQVYKDTGHAFFNDGRPSYDPDAARDAFLRTLAFFKKHLE